LINLGKIYMAIEAAEYRNLCFLAMVACFTMINHDPISEAYLIEIFNQYLIKMISYKDESTIKEMIVLINYIDQSDHCRDGDYVNMLRYLHCIDDNKSLTTSNMCKRIEDLHLTTKYKLLLKIIENPWKDTFEITKKDREVICKTFDQLYQARFYIPFAEFLKRCIEHNRFPNYLDKKFVEKMSKVKHIPNLTWLKRKKLELVSIMKTLQRAENRYFVQKSFHLEHRFHYLKEEIKVVKQCNKVIKTTCAFVAFSVAGLAFGIFKNLDMI
jgi:hypothetical protein